MGRTTSVTGMVLSASPIGEYDKRIVLLTKEKGKISAFAKGARRQNSPFLAACSPFVFGEFELYEGRSSYTVVSAGISNYFMELMTDFEGAYYGFYFAELADYYGREYDDAREMLRLLYASLLALTKKRIPYRLIRRIYELKIVCINGEGPQVFCCVGCGKKAGHASSAEKADHAPSAGKAGNYAAAFSPGLGGLVCGGCRGGREDAVELLPSTLYTLQYIVSSPVSRLYSFVVSDEVLAQLCRIVGAYLRLHTDREFRSLEILGSLEK